MNTWKSGLCDLCILDLEKCCTGCCLALWCPCCSYGRIAAAMSPEEVCCGGNNGGACCVYYVLGQISTTQMFIACAWDVIRSVCSSASFALTTIALPVPSFQILVHCMMRSAIRRRYNIPGDECEDFMVVACCPLCALVQVQTAYANCALACSFGKININMFSPSLLA